MSYERLQAQDAAFLHIEDADQPQHVGALAIFEGEPFFDERGRFRLDEVRDVIANRLHLVPRFRKRVMFVPLDQGRPVWVDDTRFDLAYHVRLTALPSPGSDAQLLALMGRLQSQLLDRRRPLWELWFVEGLEGGRVGLIQKTHHCLVDGVSGVDVATVLMDLGQEITRHDAPEWEAVPPPSPAQLLVESLLERTTEPAEIARSVRAAMRTPSALVQRASSVGRMAATAAKAAPVAPWNVPIGPHRSFHPARVPLELARAIKSAANTTLNDVVLAAVTGALREFLVHRAQPVEGLVLRAMVPVSVRDDTQRMALGNRVSTLVADLPVGEADPRRRLVLVSDRMREMKDSGMAVAADALVQMQNFAPPTVLGMASRLVARSKAVNLAITNVPGPQFPLYCMGARLLEAFPYVGILHGKAITVGVISYDGQLGFGITADRDVLPDADVVARGVERAFDELADAFDVPTPAPSTPDEQEGERVSG